MPEPDDWERRALDHVWFACAQMSDYEAFPPMRVVEASGSHLVLADGRRLVDGVSSWWCKSLGHRHPALRAALEAQAARVEHVMLAHLATDATVELAERLGRVFPGLRKVFFGGDGSTAVEIALKMSYEAQRLAGRGGRDLALALEHGYHGETQLCAALSDVGAYRRGILPALGDFPKLRGVPYVASREDPAWADAGAAWPALEAQLEAASPRLFAVVVEPILQGAGGMRVYAADLLRRLRAWTRERGVHLVADEILTGFGRTGRLMACEHAGVVPDLACVSKALTGGTLPMSAVVTSDEVYAAFYGAHEEDRAFLHSNTYAGNPLGAAVACAALSAYAEPGFLEGVARLERELRAGLEEVARATGALGPVRGVGGVVAADLRAPAGAAARARLGFRVYREAARRGALVRPIGDALYWLPPLVAPTSVVEELTRVTADAIRAALA